MTMERIQFVGACNPPTDPGRKPLTHRFVLVSLSPFKNYIYLQTQKVEPRGTMQLAVPHEVLLSSFNLNGHNFIHSLKRYNHLEQYNRQHYMKVHTLFGNFYLDGHQTVVLFYRFLRHVPVIYVDYPGPASLTQIYGTFNRAMLRIVPPLRSYAQPLTDAMVEFYSMSQVRNSP